MTTDSIQRAHEAFAAQRARVIAEYDGVADNYDAHYSTAADRAENVLIQSFLYRAIGGGDQVIDLGCGTGFVLRLLETIRCLPRSYVGVDLSQRMLDVAEAYFSPITPPNPVWKCVGAGEAIAGLARRQPGTVDVVTSLFMLHHLPYSEACSVLKYAAASLCRGGRIVLGLTNFCMADRAIVRTATHAAMSASSIVAVLEANGMEDVRVRGVGMATSRLPDRANDLLTGLAIGLDRQAAYLFPASWFRFTFIEATRA